jgi:MYXO-CTERM domain-containing protein
VPDDGTDQDCNGTDTVSCWLDADADSFGGGDVGLDPDGACDEDEAVIGGDCDDDDPLIYPGAAERCNGEDDDCDGAVPVDETTDEDGDGWLACEDCDDGDELVGGGDVEVCANGIDDDCDGDVDVEDTDCDGLIDADGDGWCEDGMDLDEDGACDGDGEPFEGEEIGDCDDGDAEVHPDAEELCDGVDSNCDPTDDAEETDDDGDGLAECDGDCDDEDERTFPGAEEVCGDSLDQDCDQTETDAHDDPECWPASCTDCSGSIATDAARGLAPLVLVVVAGLLLRRRRQLRPVRIRRRILPMLLLAGLLAPTAAQAAPSGRDIQGALTAGTCDEALRLALELTEAKPDDPKSWRYLGDAHRCVGQAHEAVMAYRHHQELGGDDPSIPGLIAGLATSLASLEVTFAASDRPATPGVEVLRGDAIIKPTTAEDGRFRIADLPTAEPLVLRIRGPGFRSDRVDLAPLTPGEVRAVQLEPFWLGFGKLALAGDTYLQVAALAPDGEVVITDEPVELTAERTELRVSAGHGTAPVFVEVVRGETTLFDPTPWEPSALRIIGLPAGATVRVFVEGPEGQAVNREATLDPTRGEVDPTTGVRVAPPFSFDSLLGGTGGLFVIHPVLGSGAAQAVLEPGALNTVNFDWATLEGVSTVQASWEQWSARRRDVRRKAARAPIALGIAAGVAGVAAAALSGGAVSAGKQATTARGLAITAADEGNPARVDSLWGDYESATGLEQGLLATSGVLSGVAVTAAGLTIAFGVKGRAEVKAVGPWDPGAGAGP